MAIPKKGSRTITVEKDIYRWLIRKKATYNQSDYGIGRIHVAIEHAENPGTTLLIITDREHPKDWNTKNVNPVTPSDILDWIRQALELGWEPPKKGSQLSVFIKEGTMERGN